MDKIQLIDIDLFAAVISFVLLISIAFRKNRYSISTKLFSIMVWINIVILLMEAITWLIDGLTGENWRRLNYLINFIFLLICSLPAITWLCYLDYQISGSIERLKKRWFYLQPFVIVALLLIYSIKTGFIFFIDKTNTYHRGPGNFILYAISYAVLITYLFQEIQQETRDYLTGLYNRRQVDEWINFRMRKHDKKGGFTLVMIDINDFKQINDTYGHKEGDHALITFSDIITRTLKQKDMIARFAGDEFLLVLETDKQGEVEAIISRLKQMVDKYNSKCTVSYDLSFSSGKAIYDPLSHRTYRDLLHQADAEMYSNKRDYKKNK